MKKIKLIFLLIPFILCTGAWSDYQSIIDEGFQCSYNLNAENNEINGYLPSNILEITNITKTFDIFTDDGYIYIKSINGENTNIEFMQRIKEDENNFKMFEKNFAIYVENILNFISITNICPEKLYINKQDSTYYIETSNENKYVEFENDSNKSYVNSILKCENYSENDFKTTCLQKDNALACKRFLIKIDISKYMISLEGKNPTLYFELGTRLNTDCEEENYIAVSPTAQFSSYNISGYGLRSPMVEYSGFYNFNMPNVNFWVIDDIYSNLDTISVPNVCYMSNAGIPSYYFYYNNIPQGCSIDDNGNSSSNGSQGEPQEGTNNDSINYNDLCSEENIINVMEILGILIFILKIVVPLLIIIFGMIDFSKAFLSSDEDSIKKASLSLIRRCIAGVIIFLIPTLILALLNIIEVSNETTTDFAKCTKCILDIKSCNSSSENSAYGGSGVKYNESK